VQENPTMVEEDVNLSWVFSIDVDQPYSFAEALNGEDSQHWKKAMDFEFQSL
jgi:beta-galactosidase/beta-glucuronidase